MRSIIKIAVLLLISMLCNFSFANLSHIKTYPGYKLNDSVGKLANLETAQIKALLARDLLPRDFFHGIPCGINEKGIASLTRFKVV